MTATTQTEPTASFFITGGTLPPDANSYVERAADRALLSALLSGDYCYVLNSRQMGKSSLSVRAIARLKAEGVRTAFVDLTRIGAQNVSAEQWYAGLLAETGRALDLRSEFLAHWKEHQHLPPVQRYFGAIREVALARLESPLVVFVDEIDAVRSLVFSADEFFAAVRACHNARTEDATYKRLTFCLVGSATPADLISDTRMSPFNIGRRIELRDFTSEEVSPLAAGLGNNGRRLLGRILYWTGGHPYLTQKLCRVCVEEGAASEADVDQRCRELFLTHTARESDDNLSFVRNRLLRSEADIASLLDAYARMRQGHRVVDDETNPLTSVLKLSGVARVEGGALKVRNRIYEHVFDRDWVETYMPDAELRRQRQAYRRGVFRTAAASAAVLVAVASLALFAETQRRLAVERNVEMRRNLYVAEMNQAQQALDAGNLELARELLQRQIPTKGQEDLREFAWSLLWHATQSSERVVLRGHSGPVYASPYTPDGKVIATASMDKTVRLWEAETGKELSVLTGHLVPITSAAISPDGTRLASLDIGPGQAGVDTFLKIWNIRDPRMPVLLASYDKGRGSFVRGFTFSPDGRSIRVVTMVFILTVDARTGEFVNGPSWPDPFDPISHAAFSADGKAYIVTGRHSIRVYAEPGHNIVREVRYPDGPISALAISRDGRTLAVGGEDRAIQCYDMRTWKPIARFQSNDAVNFAAFSPDGRTLATGGVDGALRLWRTETWTPVARLRGHSKRITSIQFSPDSASVVTASEDGTARIWDNRSRPDLGSPFAPTSHFGPYSLSPSGGQAALCDSDAVTLWRGQTLVRMIRKPLTANWPYTDSAFSPDGKTLATASPADHVGLWDTATGRRIGKLLKHDHNVYCLAFSPNGALLAGGSRSGTVKIWDAATRRLLHYFSASSSEAINLAFSPDNRRLVVCANDGEVSVWDVAAEKKTRVILGHMGRVNAVRFSPDGRLMATAGEDGVIRLWDSLRFRPAGVLKARLNNVADIAFSPDGSTLASVHRRDAVALWNMRLRREVAILRSDDTSLTRVAFTPDGKTLTAGTYFGPMRVWRTEPLPVDSRTEQDLIAQNERTERSETKRIVDEQNEGAVRDWLVLASLPIDPKRFDTLMPVPAIPMDALLAPLAGQATRVNGTSWMWRRVQTANPLLDLNAIEGKERPYAQAYAVSYVVAPQEMAGVRLRIGDDDYGDVYINGEAVYRNRTGYGAMDEAVVDGVRLRKGLNLLVIRVVNLDGGWNGSVRFLDQADRPLTQLTFTSSPAPDALADLNHRLAPVRRDLSAAKPWQPETDLTGLDRQGDAEATVSIDGNTCRVHVTEADGTDWHIRVFRSMRNLRGGALYKIRFRARADRPHDIGLAVQADGEDWREVGKGTDIHVGTDWRWYEHTFRATRPAPVNRAPAFVLGKETGTYWFSDLSVNPLP